MTDTTQDNKRTIAGFFGRTARLLLRPAKEFARIASEPETARKVTTTWVIPWVGIMLAANVVRAFIFGDPIEAEINGVSGEMMRLPLKAIEVPGLTLPLFVMSVVMPFVMALVINAFARLFGSQRNYVRAVRTAAYAGTPAWVVGVFSPAWTMSVLHVTPPLSIGLFLGALWSTYLLFRGLAPMMGCPRGKALSYTAAVVAVMLVLWLIAFKFFYAIASSLRLHSFSGSE